VMSDILACRPSSFIALPLTQFSAGSHGNTLPAGLSQAGAGWNTELDGHPDALLRGGGQRRTWNPHKEQGSACRRFSLDERSKPIYEAMMWVLPESVTFSGRLPSPQKGRMLAFPHLMHSHNSASLHIVQGGGKKYKRWRVASLVEVHHARFLLRPFALEFFLADQANALLSFASSQVCFHYCLEDASYLFSFSLLKQPTQQASQGGFRMCYTSAWRGTPFAISSRSLTPYILHKCRWPRMWPSSCSASVHISQSLIASGSRTRQTGCSSAGSAGKSPTLTTSCR